MARIINPVFGEIKGVVDGCYTKKLRNKIYIAACPKRLKKTMDDGSVGRRKKFSVTAQFAKAVRSLEPLEAVWKMNLGKCLTAHHAICKKNYPLSSPERPTEQNVITPEGFDPGIEKAEVYIDKISAVIPVLSAVSYAGQGVLLSLNALVCFFDAAGINPDRYQLFAFCREFENYDFSESKTVLIDFSPEEKDLAGRYGKALLYIALVVKGNDGRVIDYSSTYSKEIL
jgi:hypothetical protein